MTCLTDCKYEKIKVIIFTSFIRAMYVHVKRFVDNVDIMWREKKNEPQLSLFFFCCVYKFISMCVFVKKDN